MNDEKKKMGCFAKGCLIVLIIGLIFGIVAGIGAYGVYSWAKSFTAEAPEEIQVLTPTQEQYELVHNRWQNVDAKGAEFSPQDLNILIAGHPDWSALKGKVQVEKIEDGLVTVKVSVPLSQIPGFRSRYLNGHLVTSLSVQDGQVAVVPQKILVNGKELPNEILQSFKEAKFSSDLNASIQQDPNLSQWFNSVQQLTVENNKIRIQKVPEENDSSSSPPVDTISTERATPPESASETKPNVEKEPEPTPSKSEPEPTSSVPSQKKGKYVGLSLDDVKKQLGSPHMTTEDGDEVTLHYANILIISKDGMMVTDEKNPSEEN